MATAKAIPLRLNFVDVVCDDSLKHLYVNGKKAGCQFDVRLSYYRGHFLSVIDRLEVEIDGEKISQEAISFCLRDEEYGIAQLHDLVSVSGIVEPATIKVLKKGGFTAGEHDINFICISEVHI
ncbi:MAG: DUF6379 domain-containing protein [Eubacterium ramulus]